MFTTPGKVVAVMFMAMMAAENTAVVQAAAISLNFAPSGTTAVGANAAGVVFVGNWNDVPLDQQSLPNLALKDDTGATVPGLTLQTTQTYAFNSSAFSASNVFFPNPGNTAMMRGHIYHAKTTPVDLIFTGSIPYAKYDVYVYYNANQTQTQTFSILNSAFGSLGLSQTGAESSASDSTFVQSNNAGNNANYVLFSGLTSADVPTNFVIRASNGGNYNYINGLQIVEVPVPEPGTSVLMMGALAGLAMFRRRRNK